MDWQPEWLYACCLYCIFTANSVMITFSYVIDIIRRVYQIKFDCIATIKLHLQDITLAPARIENEIILLWYVIIYSKQHEWEILYHFPTKYEVRGMSNHSHWWPCLSFSCFYIANHDLYALNIHKSDFVHVFWSFLQLIHSRTYYCYRSTILEAFVNNLQNIPRISQINYRNINVVRSNPSVIMSCLNIET